MPSPYIYMLEFLTLAKKRLMEEQERQFEELSTGMIPNNAIEQSRTAFYILFLPIYIYFKNF